MRILMRGAMDPLAYMSPSQFIIENHTGGNIGNLIFINSIARTLLVDDDTTIDYVYLRRVKLNQKYADFVNENYDIFLIPLANAFKVSGHDEMTMIADFVKMLKIPCCIVGVGIQRNITPGKFIDYYQFNDEAKAMVSAILDKSPIIGVRGEITADYLKDLGFLPEKDFTVIGCPSMFTYGDTLPAVKHTILTPDSVVSLNSKIEFEAIPRYETFMDLTRRSMAEFKNAIYVQQQIDDVRMIYLDSLKTELRENKTYDIAKAVSFTNIHSWIEYFKNHVDFSFGTRIHGNVAAVLGGVPAVTVPFDQRVLELSEYHKIPMLPFSQITEETTLYDVFEKADFESVHRGHKERFDHYIDFLHTLGLDTIYDHTYTEDVPFDRIQNTHEYPEVVKAFEAIPHEEQLDRYRDSFLLYRDKFKNANEKIRTKNEQLEELREERKELRREVKRLSKYTEYGTVSQVKRKAEIYDKLVNFFPIRILRKIKRLFKKKS